MNKILKCAFGLLTLITLNIVCFSNADNFCSPILVGAVNINYGETDGSIVRDNGYYYACYLSNNGSMNITIGGINYSLSSNEGICVSIDDYPNGGNFPIICNSTHCSLGRAYFGENCVSMTSMQCQTEYNLIPISEVTPNYCALNFGMIDPQECPINEGTGAIVRSNLMINDVPYAQNQNINVFIPDFLAWNLSFNDLYTVIEVEGYNADEEYIENVINNEKLTPTNKDIEEMLTGFMTNYFPYLALAIVFLYLARKIFKLFK